MENNQNNSEYEIDLIEIKNRVGAFVKKTMKGIFRFLIRKGLWLVLFALLGLGTGYLYYLYFYVPVYRTVSLVEVNHVQPAYFVLHIKRLNRMLEQENTKKIADVLNLSEEEVATIREVHVRWGIDEEMFSWDRQNIKINDSLQLQYNRLMEVSFLVSDQSVIPKLSQALSSYMYSNESFARVVEMETAYLDEVIATIDKQIILLDSMILNQNQPIGKLGGNHPMIFLAEPKSYHFDVLQLHEKRQYYARKREFESSACRMHFDFVSYISLEADLYSKLRVFIFSFLLIGVLMFILLDNRSEISKWINDDL